MTFQADTRGHVPFAVLGVLLVVLAVIATGVTPTPPPVAHPPTEAADQTTAVVETTLTEATQAAGAEAAAAPVLEPAGFGTVLNETTPYQSYLELLVYHHLQTRLANTTIQAGDHVGTATLPPITDADTAAVAINRTTVTPVEPGLVRVTVSDLSVDIHTDGEVVHTETTTPTATVVTPALTLHDLMDDFETRLNRNPIEGPGLGRGVTARLTAIGWARGYAQYGGAPVDDVIGLRHIELATAGAMLDHQRAAFGTADPQSTPALHNGTARTAAADLVPDDFNGLAAGALPDPAEQSPPEDATIDRSEEDTTVTVGAAADRAFTQLLDGDQTVADIVDAAYDMTVRVDTTTALPRQTLRHQDQRPGPEWERVDTHEDVTVTDVEVPPDSAPMPAAPTVADWQRLETAERIVTLDRHVETHWRHGSNRTTTTKEYTEEHAVTLAIHGQPTAVPEGPDRPIDDLATRGGPVDSAGPTPAERAIDAFDGVDTIAATAAKSDGYHETTELSITPPEPVVHWVLRDLAELRETVRNVSHTTGAHETMTGTPPREQLRTHVVDERPRLLGAPDRYETRAHRGQIAARDAYLSALETELAADDDLEDQLLSTLRGELGDRINVPADAIATAVETTEETTRPSSEPIVGPEPVGELDIAAEVEPPYPARTPVADPGPRTPTGEHTPLGIRMTTVASPPLDALTDPLVDRLFATDSVSLPVAARALGAADALPESMLTGDRAAARATLEESVTTELDTIEAAAVEALAAETTVTEDEAADAVAVGLGEWSSPADQVRAIERNEAPAIIAATLDRPAHEQEAAVSTLAVAFEEAMAEATVDVPEGKITSIVDAQHAILEDEAEELAEAGLDVTLDRLDDRLDGRLSMVPAGVPVLPKPGAWWATANAWTIELDGELPAVALRSSHGSPREGGTVTYQRQNETVTRDLTGDGTVETLGHSPPVTFDTWGVVVVVVPPGGGGVGNTDSDAVECSAGWDDPCLRP